MPAGFPTNAFLPRLQWDAKAGILLKVDRPQLPDGSRGKQRAEIALKDFVALADPDSVRKGWVHLAPGVYEDHLVGWTQKVPPRPSGQDGKGKPLWQPYVLFHVKLAPALGGDVRQFASTAIVVINSLDALIDGWLAAPAANDPGQCPVIQITGRAAISSANGTNYAPVWRTAGWRLRPEDMPIGGADEEYDQEGGNAAEDAADPWGAAAPPPEEQDSSSDNDDLPF